jgi:hypothetical protein
VRQAIRAEPVGWVGANGSSERAPDDKLRGTNHVLDDDGSREAGRPHWMLPAFLLKWWQRKTGQRAGSMPGGDPCS